MNRNTTVIAIGIALAMGTAGEGTTAPLGAQEVGPANGSLVVVGGAMQDLGIVRRFIDLAGGPDAPIVVIPTAGGAAEYDQFYPGLRQFRAAGATNLTVIHTNDRDEADSGAFVRPIREAGGVWFPGGRQWRIADSYLDTRTEEELHRLLERGGVIGGSSAGASIQGSYLIRGDTQTNTIMMGDHEEGLKGCFGAVGFFKAQIEQAQARVVRRRIRRGSQICFQPVDDVVEVAVLRESRACKTDEE